MEKIGLENTVDSTKPLHRESPLQGTFCFGQSTVLRHQFFANVFFWIAIDWKLKKKSDPIGHKSRNGLERVKREFLGTRPYQRSRPYQPSRP